MSKTEKQKALDAVMSKLEKTYGKGAVMKLGDAPHMDIETISTGSLGLDVALGTLGFPKGRIVEIYGYESSGKTTIAIHAIAECQKSGGTAAFIDAEHAFDRYYAESLGVNVDDLIFSQPDYGEQALEIAEALIRSNTIDLLVIDSVAALVPRSEIEGEMGDSKMGLQARLMSQAMRKITSAIGKAKCCCIFINQMREKIGIMFGNPNTTTGGNALKFYASQRLEVSKKSAAVKDRQGDAIASHVKVKVVKNKLAPPFKIAEFDIEFGTGISKAGEIVDLGVEYDIIEKAGSWFSYEGAKLGQGRDNVKQFLLDNPELSDEIELKVKNFITNSK
jgi:recombination protein RecA